MVDLGFFDAANPTGQTFLPKNGVFCHFWAFLGHFLPFSIKKWPKMKLLFFGELVLFDAVNLMTQKIIA